MYDEQQETGTDEAPDRDVRWEGAVARYGNRAHEFNRTGQDWKLIDVSAADLGRLITEREQYQAAVAAVRKLHSSFETEGPIPKQWCSECSAARQYVPWPCDTMKVIS